MLMVPLAGLQLASARQGSCGPQTLGGDVQPGHVEKAMKAHRGLCYLSLSLLLLIWMSLKHALEMDTMTPLQMGLEVGHVITSWA